MSIQEFCISIDISLVFSNETFNIQISIIPTIELKKKK